MSDFVVIDQIISRVNALITENEQCQQSIENLERDLRRVEFDLRQVQDQLEHYYLLSRQQSKVLELNEQLHERSITLLAQSSVDCSTGLWQRD